MLWLAQWTCAFPGADAHSPERHASNLSKQVIVEVAGDEHLKNPQADSKSLTVTLTKSSRKPWKDLFQVAGPQGLE